MTVPGGSAEKKIISFYSFKGGSGRSMAVANAAWILASNGKSVLVVDWDLETPGLHVYFNGYLAPAGQRESSGVLDMFTAFAAAGQDASADNLRALHDEHTDFERYATAVEFDFPDGGSLDYLGPGCMDDAYVRLLHGFDWMSFHDSEDGREYLAALRARMLASDYDYILIDGRSGFADGARICTLALPDTVVLGLAMDRQSIEGAERVARQVSLNSRRTELHVLPMRVDASSERDRLRRYLADARRRLSPYLAVRGEEELERYWGEVQVPYQPFYAFGEELAAMTDDPADGRSLLAQYVKAVGRITDGRVSGYRKVPQRQARQYQEIIAQSGRAQSVVMLHAPEDWMWAEWINEQLAANGLDVVLRQQERVPTGSAQELPALPPADLLLVLLSPSLQRAPVGETALAVRKAAGAGGGRRLVGVRISAGRIPPHFDWAGAHNLAGLGEDAARQALLADVGVAAQDAQRAPSSQVLRFPGTKPEVFRAPMRNRSFVGRADDLEALRSYFWSGDSPVPMVLWGLKGEGKRQIALEHLHRTAALYDLVWWIPAGTEEGARAELAELTAAVNRATEGQRTSDDWQSLLDDLGQGRYYPRWLLVFEDAASMKLVQPYLPEGDHGHVLITSRSSDWPEESYELRHAGVFSAAESLDLLGRVLRSEERAELAKLAERVGNLPLYLHAAASWLREYPQEIDDYIGLLDRSTATPDAALPEAHRAFAEVISVSYDSLLRLNPAAAKLLQLCAFMSPDGIQLRILESPGMLTLLEPFAPALRTNPMRLRSVLQDLGRQALAVMDQVNRALKVHRAVQDFVRARMTPEEYAATRAEVQGLLAGRSPTVFDRDNPLERRVFAELDKHVLACEPWLSEDPAVCAWLVHQVRYRWSMEERWQASADLGTRTLEHWRPALGEEHDAVLQMESQVGAAYRMLGRYQEALGLSRHAVKTRDTAAVGPSEQALLDGRGYAADLRATGRFREALLEDRRAHTGLAQAFGADHAETLSASGNLALSKFYLETVDAAVRQDEDTYQRRKHTLGEGDARTWRSYANIGSYLREAGRLDQSRLYLQAAAEQLKRALGPDSSLTLWAQQSLGMTQLRLGESGQALQLLLRAHMVFKREWGDRHPRTMSSRLAVAGAMHAEDRALGTHDAANWTREALEDYVALFSDDHPFTAVCRTNLSVYELASGNAAAARTHAAKAVYQLKDSFSREHRYALVARMNEINCLAALGELQGSELAADDERISEACAGPAGWGPDHQITLTARANLADSRPDSRPGLEEAVQRLLPTGHSLASRILARPYLRIGADLEVFDV